MTKLIFPLNVRYEKHSGKASCIWPAAYMAVIMSALNQLATSESSCSSRQLFGSICLNLVKGTAGGRVLSTLNHERGRRFVAKYGAASIVISHSLGPLPLSRR
jgi:hypothetical protein